MSQLEGTIEETLPKGLFRVVLDDGRSVRAALSTSAKKLTVKLIPGDRVALELSPYDPTRGKIQQRR
ncbi:MAG: translation initiation factor IF-1 [Myxococcota bacterium]